VTGKRPRTKEGSKTTFDAGNNDDSSCLYVTYHVTYHVWPHQPIIDQQGLGLRGLVHKEAHPVIPDLHYYLFKDIYARCIHSTLIQRIPPVNNPIRKKYCSISLVHLTCLSLQE